MRLILAVAFFSVACHHKAHDSFGPPIRISPGSHEGDLFIPAIVTGKVEEHGTLDKGVCSICKKQGKKSTVTMDGFASCTAMFCSASLDTYDTDGHLLPKTAAANCNTCTRYGRCSNGHTVTQVE